MAYRSNLTQAQIATHLGLPLTEVKAAAARAMVDLGRALTGQAARSG
jgi:DNA-directed RNA polymerase specialized sigma24 family protein